MELKGSQTEKSLLKAFLGESQARNRYNYYASQAKKEGFEQICAIFTETADNEKEHAKVFFKYLQTAEILEITASFSAGKIGSTLENLKQAAAGEKLEWSQLYPDFSRIALEEGFEDIANSFQEISKVEIAHENRYRKISANIENKRVFEKLTSVKWKCRNCGYISHGKYAPEICPSCKHLQSYYEIFTENY